MSRNIYVCLEFTCEYTHAHVYAAKSALYWNEGLRNASHINYKVYCFFVRKSMFRQHPIVRGQVQR